MASLPERIRTLLEGLTPEGWREARERLFEALVEEGLDHVGVEAVLREAARRVGATLEAMRRSWSDYLGPVPPEENAASKLIGLALEAGVGLWHTPQGEAWATIPRNGHREHHPVRGRAFRLWLAGLYYGKMGKPPYAQALQDALATLEAKALFEGPERRVFVRLGEYGGRLYLDLGREDWLVVEVGAEGWRLVDAADCPVAFHRPPHQRPLPLPEGPGDMEGFLSLFPLEGRERALVLGWLVGTLAPRGPYPVLLLTGPKGAGKTTLARMLKTLVDPSEGGMRLEPRGVEDLVLGARGGLVLGLDNLAGLPPWLSDALCVLSTGGALSKRQLYTDAEEVVLEVQRPVILTGIGLGSLRDDLADRTIRLELPRLPDGGREAEEALWEAFRRVHPRALAALLDAASLALRRKEEVRRRLQALPRMADWAIWAEAAAPALGLGEGEVLAAFLGVQAEMEADLLESDLVARAVLELTGSWAEGEARTYTVAELLQALEEAMGLKEARAKPQGWPRTPQALGRHLPRVQAALRGAGVVLEARRDSHLKRNFWVLRLLEKAGEETPQTPQTPQSASWTGKSPAGFAAGLSPQTPQTPHQTPQEKTPSGSQFAASAGFAGFIPPDFLKPKAAPLLEAHREAWGLVEELRRLNREMAEAWARRLNRTPLEDRPRQVQELRTSLAQLLAEKEAQPWPS
ncbi:DNA primase [Thermus sp.]|uniref:DNA primase n=1 Tax=Thermus sp. TaxID=275 RepID=UPI00262FCBA7|nr:DNA primase [Thermus sp.]MCX7850029.1 DNA primase [Thermus sp.]